LALIFNEQQRWVLPYRVPKFFELSVYGVLSQYRLKGCRIKKDVDIF
jgi:hypothetical protein